MEQLELENQDLKAEVATLKESLERNNQNMEALLARLEQEDTIHLTPTHGDATPVVSQVSQPIVSTFVFGADTTVATSEVTPEFIPRYRIE